MNERPIARGLILCEKVVVEEKSRFVSLVNCFTRKKIARFPSEPMDFVLFALLLNGRGPVRLEAIVEDAATSVEIDRHSGICEFRSPLSEVRFQKQYSNVSFPTPGDYEFQLLADGEIIANTVLHLQNQ
jgi:hypothetical protein